MDPLEQIFRQRKTPVLTGKNADARPSLQEEGYREPEVDEVDYYRVLNKIHETLRPRTYLEVGTRYGESLSLVQPQTQAIAVDPEPELSHAIRCSYELFTSKSDDFFDEHNVQELLKKQPVNLSFIDGFHHFEYVLRDFINLERVSDSSSIVLLHDCIPIDQRTATRERETRLWTGDVWKIVICLKQERPDLKLDIFDTGPTGICAIQNLDPSNTTLLDQYDDIVRRYVDLPFSTLGDEREQRDLLNVCASDDKTIEAVCAPTDRFHPST